MSEDISGTQEHCTKPASYCLICPKHSYCLECRGNCKRCFFNISCSHSKSAKKEKLKEKQKKNER